MICSECVYKDEEIICNYVTLQRESRESSGGGDGGGGGGDEEEEVVDGPLVPEEVINLLSS